MNIYVICLAIFIELRTQVVAEVVRPRLQGLAPGDVIYLSGKMAGNDEVEIHFHYRSLNGSYEGDVTRARIAMKILLSPTRLSIVGNDLLGPALDKTLTIDDDFAKQFDILMKVTTNRYENSIIVDRGGGRLAATSVFIDGIELVHIVNMPDSLQFGIDGSAATNRIMRTINFTYERGFDFTFTPGQRPMSFNFLDLDDNILAQVGITPQSHTITMASHFGAAWQKKASFEQYPGTQCYVQNRFTVVNTFQGISVEYGIGEEKIRRCYEHTTPRPWQAYAKLLVVPADGWVDRIRELADSTPECVNAGRDGITEEL